MTAGETSQTNAKPVSGESALRAWILTIGINIVLPLVTYFALTGLFGVGEVVALLLSGAWPLLEMLVTVRRQGHVDEFSLFVLIGIAIAVITGVFSDDARALFLKDSITNGLLGVVFLVTLLGRPLTFYLGRRFATDGSKVQRDWWNGLWRHPQFRRVQRQLGAIWGVTLVVESTLRAALTWRLGTTAMVLVNGVLPYVVTAALMFVSIWIGGRSRKAAAARYASGANPPAAEAPVG